METNPKSFRKEHLAIRNAMSEKEVAEKSGVIVKRLLQTGWYQNAQEIFAYYPLKNEVDCRALFLQAWSDGKKIALPRTREENQMDFYYIDDFMQLKEGANSDFVGNSFEFMKSAGRGAKGHIAVGTLSVERALEWFAGFGVKPVAETIKMKGNHISVAYLDKEICGFAVHLNRR